MYKFKTLLGHKNLAFSIACLKSFLERSKDAIILEIFEDGSITKEDEQALQFHLPGSCVVWKKERSSLIEQKLSSFPKCSQFQKEHVLAQKLFDIMLHKEEDTFFIDSDIYFLKNFKLPTFEYIPTFMLDTQNAYSIKPLDFFKIKQPVFPKINSGILFFPNKYFDLPFLETLLQDIVFKNGTSKYKGWAEQTLWAFLASKTGRINYFDEAQLSMASENLSINEKTIAVHLVSSFRHHFERVKTITYEKDGSFADIKINRSKEYLKGTRFFSERFSNKVGSLIPK